jgi:hypothetical protein
VLPWVAQARQWKHEIGLVSAVEQQSDRELRMYRRRLD